MHLWIFHSQSMSGITDQIQEKLLDLVAAAHNWRQILRKLNLQMNAFFIELTLRQSQRFRESVR